MVVHRHLQGLGLPEDDVQAHCRGFCAFLTARVKGYQWLETSQIDALAAHWAEGIRQGIRTHEEGVA